MEALVPFGGAAEHQTDHQSCHLLISKNNEGDTCSFTVVLKSGSSINYVCVRVPQFGVAWRWSVCGTAEVVWKPRFLWQWPSAHLHFLVSCFSFSSWQYPIDSLCSGLVSLLASQAHKHHGHLTNFWCFCSVAGAKSCWKMKSASLKSWSAEGSMKCSKMSW